MKEANVHLARRETARFFRASHAQETKTGSSKKGTVQKRSSSSFVALVAAQYRPALVPLQESIKVSINYFGSRAMTMLRHRSLLFFQMTTSSVPSEKEVLYV
ncbi:MAG: hypothetical protein WCD70_06840 [Alphaproteobacteria bacterium]